MFFVRVLDLDAILVEQEEEYLDNVPLATVEGVHGRILNHFSDEVLKQMVDTYLKSSKNSAGQARSSSKRTSTSTRYLYRSA